MNAPIAVIEHEKGCPVDRFAGWVGDGVQLDLVRAWQGDALPAVEGVAGLIVLGGQMGAYDDDVAAWLPATRRLLREAVAAQLPVLGICLGAQLLAAACDGRVERGAAGVEVGVVDVAWRGAARDDGLVAGLPAPFPGPSMHQDAVVELPPGAVWLGSSSMYAHQVFRVGSCAWGVQFHPEVSPQIYRQWAELRPTEAKARAVRQMVERDEEVAAAGRLLAERFAGVVRQRTMPSPGTNQDEPAPAPLSLPV